MSIVTKPATDLPWSYDSSIKAHNGKLRVANTLTQYPAPGEKDYIGAADSDDNGHYIATAANYFPRLLAALSELADQNTAPSEAQNRARDLLRELGVK